jgi:GntR family transcriptional regulator / MocR family aminotransferase
MGKRSAAFELTLRSRKGGKAAYKWLYGEVRGEILDGRLRPGARLSSTRELAERYGLSRGTVVNAFELLKAEGYIQGTVGSGTFVSQVLPDDLLTVRYKTRDAVRSHTPRRHFSEFGRRVQYELNFEQRPVRAFRANLPAVDLFPMKQWSAIATRVTRNASSELLIGCNAIGYTPLREAIADYLNSWRGVRCSTEQVLIVSGVQEALDLAARVLLDPGDRVCVEDPGYPAAWNVFEACGANVRPIPVDEEGLQVREAAMCDARLVYVTPGHQAPLAVTMSLRRRLALLEWAERNHALIFEDDYDGEYRYSNRPLPALHGLDRSDSVIYAGSFNKVLFPSLRVGYVVAAPDIIARLEAVKSMTSRHTQLIDQAVLTEFIRGGHFARHLRRMREIYAERLNVLLESVRAHLRGILEISDVEAGLQTAAWLCADIDANELQQVAAARGIHVTALSTFAKRPLNRDGLQLGFAPVGPGEIRRGVETLARILCAMRV